MAKEKRYYWLKLKEDFFTDKKMKKLRKIAGGDTYTIIYLKLLLLGLRDSGKLLYDGIEDSFSDELALEIDEEPDNVKIAMLTLLKMGLIEEISENELFLTRLPECIGSETRQAEIMRRKRELENVKGNKGVTMLPDVTKSYTEIEKDKEIDKDKDIKPKIDYQQIVDMYNKTCVSLSRVTVLSDRRKRAIKARLNTYTVDQFAEVFKKAESSSFLKGESSKWRATFDWLIEDGNFAKVLDGNYEDKAPIKKKGDSWERDWNDTNNPYLQLEEMIVDWAAPKDELE